MLINLHFSEQFSDDHDLHFHTSSNADFEFHYKHILARTSRITPDLLTNIVHRDLDQLLAIVIKEHQIQWNHLVTCAGPAICAQDSIACARLLFATGPVNLNRKSPVIPLSVPQCLIFL